MAACLGFIMAMVKDVFRRRRPTAADVAAAEARLERIEADLTRLTEWIEEGQERAERIR
jgi:glutathione S-transferase